MGKDQNCKKAYAPYNFMPFSESIDKVPHPYSSRKEIVGNMPESGKDRISGYIEFDIKLDTPLYIGGLKDENDREIPFMDGNGNAIIPGSTIRGLIKSHVEMLSFSYPQIEDRRFMYRKFADKCKKIRNEYELKLKGKDKKEIVGVKCGIIYKDDQDKYFIQPLKNFDGMDKNYISVHETDLRDQGLLNDNQYMYSGRIIKFKEYKETIKDDINEYKDTIRKYKNKKYKVYRNTKKIILNKNGRRFEGILLNSEWMDGKTHHYLVSGDEKGEPIPINKNDILNYKHDYEVKCIQNKKLKENKSFYAVPEEIGKANGKVFFYKERDDRKGILGFGPTKYFRIFYDHSVCEGIPYIKNTEGYDYAEALFGFIETDDSKKRSMKSRLSFQNVKVKDKVADKDLIREKIELLSPKGTAFQLYLDQKGKEISNLNTYNDDGFKLRGYKVYLKRSEPTKKCDCIGSDYNKNGNKSKKEPNKKILSRCVFLPPEKTKFEKARIYYENLNSDELGLLLLAVKYNSSSKESHMIGHAKPYGYGKVLFENVSLYEFDFKKRFSDLSWDSTGENISEKIEFYKEVYKEKISSLLQIDKSMYEELDTVKAYREYIFCENMDKSLKANSVYMDIKKDSGKPSYGNRNILPDWDELMKKYRNH